jgi:hypothetical protein
MNKQIDLTKFKAFLYEYLPAMDEKIPTYINRGGCGFFAVHFSRVLTEMKIEHKVYALWEGSSYEDDQSANELKRLQKTKNINWENYYGIGHAIIEINGDWFDAQGKPDSDFFEDGVVKVEVSDKNLDYLVQSGKHWNDTFDTSLEPKIESYLKAIPETFKKWKAGSFVNHIESNEDNKRHLNSYTKEHDRW